MSKELDTQGTDELIPIQDNNGKQTVSLRQLYEFLESSRVFTDWAKDMFGYGFTEDVDYVEVYHKNVVKPKRGRPQRNWDISIDMAKELSMIQRTSRGKQARLYFIEVEKRAREEFSRLSEIPTGAELFALALREADIMLKAKDEEIAKKEVVIDKLVPLARQARTFNESHGSVGRQEFARDVVSWAKGEGYKVTCNQVYVFLASKLGMFIQAGRRDSGTASANAIRAERAENKRGFNRDGYGYVQGLLTPKGVEYAWSRITDYVVVNGTLRFDAEGSAKV